jgi:hypothetical protein
VKIKTMTKIEEYRETLRQIEDWDEFLLSQSGLPGPRGNIELAQAAALEGDERRFADWLSYTAEIAPTNTPGEFLAFCGVLGMGKLLAEGRREMFALLRQYANDPRWRTREAVAMALQNLGRHGFDALIAEMHIWAKGTPLEKRAAAAALCEPDLLQDHPHTAQVLDILNEITRSIEQITERRAEAFIALRKGLGYCWSVAIAAYPRAGKPLLESWLSSRDADIRWILRENLQKKRLERMDAAWVSECLFGLQGR